jgi:hypothetical protein
MTKPQLIKLLAKGGLWAEACAYQGWDADDRELRMAELSKAVGRALSSSKDLNRTTDYDRVVQHLEQLAGKFSQHDGLAGRYRDKVARQIQCLALYVPDAVGYVKAVIKDKFRRAGCETEAFKSADAARIVDWLSDKPSMREVRGELFEVPSHLHQLVMTLDGRLNKKGTGLRNLAGHTLHDMHTKAGLQCDCKMCATARRSKVQESKVQGRQEELVGASVEEPF